MFAESVDLMVCVAMVSLGGHSDWFKLKMIMAFSFNKLFPRIPALPPKTQFIKIKFVNQG